MPEQQGEQIGLLDEHGIIQSGWFLESKRPDKKGLVRIVDEDGSSRRVHPKRVMSEKEGSLALFVGNEVLAPCPECHNLWNVNEDNDQATCSEHGKYNVITVGRKRSRRSSGGSKAPTKVEKVNYKELDDLGELWIVDDVNFDHNHINVKTCRLVLPSVSKHISFNTYDDTFGRKGKKPPYEEALNGEDVGYNIKDYDKLISKLKDKGYKRYSGS